MSGETSGGDPIDDVMNAAVERGYANRDFGIAAKAGAAALAAGAGAAVTKNPELASGAAAAAITAVGAVAEGVKARRKADKLDPPEGKKRR